MGHVPKCPTCARGSAATVQFRTRTRNHGSIPLLAAEDYYVAEDGG